MTKARWRRVALVVVTIVALALLWPVLRDVYGALANVNDLAWGWFVGVVVFAFVQALANVQLHRIVLRSRAWLDVGAPLLAGNAASHLLPGGNALGAGLQIRMMTVAGFPLTQTLGALGAVTVVGFVFGYVGLPLVVLLSSAAGTDIDSKLILPLWIGVVVLAIVIIVVIATIVRDRPWRRLAHLIAWIRLRVRRPVAVDDLERRLLDERDLIVQTFRLHPVRVAMCEIGRGGSDFIALYCALRAAGADLNPAAVLAAFVVSNIAGMIPLTPGGLGFVEAGLAGVVTFAGATAAQTELGVATYRLVATWIPCLLGAVLLVWFQRRHREVATTELLTAPLPDVMATESSGDEHP
jgi:uncharacterized protein (TIRG00374 family)